jgi:hypothetical protein
VIEKDSANNRMKKQIAQKKKKATEGHTMAIFIPFSANMKLQRVRIVESTESFAEVR